MNSDRRYRPTAAAPAALIFHHYAEQIKHEEGIDVYECKEDLPAIEALLKKLRKEGSIADQSALDEAWTEHLRNKGILPKAEQQAKDEFTLQSARDTKESLRVSGMADAARFGYCKRQGCEGRKQPCLLFRGFCPSCHGKSVKQAIATGGLDVLLFRKLADATSQEMQTSLVVSTNRRKVHPATKKPTTEERRAIVHRASKQYAELSVSELAKLLKLPRQTVSDILKTATVKTTPENTEEVEQFLRNRNLKNKRDAEPAAGEERGRERSDRPSTLYVLAETVKLGEANVVETVIHCPACHRSVIPGFHYDSRGGCLPSDVAATSWVTRLHPQNKS
jgi:hypothetical protein